MFKTINAKNVLRFLSSIALTLFVGGLSAILTRGENDFYTSLNLPPFAPSPVVFGIVWTILYVLLGISLYVARPLNKNSALSFGVLLLFLFVWPIIFFIFKNIPLSLIWIVLTLIVCAVTTVRFYNENKLSGILLLPLLLWIIFATVLNGAIYFLNR
jgi:tryptophan-rich sensory protein